jgi:endoglucanase
VRLELFLLLCLALGGTSNVQAQTNPVKMATQARFDLMGSTSVGVISNGYMLLDYSSVARQSWIDPTNQPLSYTVQFAIVHFAWTEAAFQFTPASNGTVTLTLRGPWEQSPDGPIYRQEVLWDACSATNATINNGSFEIVSGGAPVGWTPAYGDPTVDTGPVTPVDGTNCARVWHDGPWNYTFAVTGGLPVTLHFYARAVFPTNFTDMQRITSTNTPARLAALKFMRGVNLGNYLEAPPGQDWGAYYTTNDFINVRNEGFDHVRIPGGWNFYTGPAPGCTVSNSYFAKEDFMVTNALNQGLGVIINIHNWSEFMTNAPAWTNEFYAIWRQIAAYYSNSPPQVAFELINEPSGPGSTTTMLNPIYAEAIRQIRLTNPNRTIFVGPSQWNGISELSNLILPDTDSNLIVTVHCYDPFYFTHQGATWPGPDTATVGVLFPGPPPTPLTPAAGVSVYVTNWIADYNTIPAERNPSSPIAFRAKLQMARQWSDYYGRPVHVGEFGAYTMADPVSRANFYTAIRGTFDGLGLGWAMWDWKAGFHYWDANNGQPAPGMRAAMFPAPQLISTVPGQFKFDGAVAKTFVIERAFSLVSPPNWAGIQTQTLSRPQLFFTDPDTGRTNAAFYRARWVK